MSTQFEQLPPNTIEVAFNKSGAAVVRLGGEHDVSSTSRLTDALWAACARRDVLVDLSECMFMDSSGVNALLGARQDLAKRGGRLELVIPDEATTIQRFADITLLGAILPIHKTQTAALAKIDAAPVV